MHTAPDPDDHHRAAFMIEDLSAGLGLAATHAAQSCASTRSGQQSRRPSSIKVTVSGHRPIIEPFIIQSFQSPFMC